MKIVAVICNVIYWGFLCMLMATDGLPRGADILYSLLPFVMPIFNVVIMRFLPSPGRAVNLVAMVGNIIWLVLACWLIIDRYPSHPKEEGLLAYVVLLALTPLLSMVALYPRLRATETPRAA
jgi:hypothetical protein